MTTTKFSLHRMADCAPSLWKNGKGETFQRFILPVNSDLTNFDVRISMARVQTDGPFSIFPNINRHLMVLEGRGLTLTSSYFDSIELNAESSAFEFDGQWHIDSRLLDQEVLDFNVMVKKDYYHAGVNKVRLLPGKLVFPPSSMLLLLLLAPALISTPIGDVSVNKYDLLQLAAGEAIYLLGEIELDVIQVDLILTDVDG